MTAGLPAKDRTPTSARVLNLWLRDAQNLTGVAERRIGWLLASTVAALQRALGGDEFEASLDAAIAEPWGQFVLERTPLRSPVPGGARSHAGLHRVTDEILSGQR